MSRSSSPVKLTTPSTRRFRHRVQRSLSDMAGPSLSLPQPSPSQQDERPPRHHHLHYHIHKRHRSRDDRPGGAPLSAVSSVQGQPKVSLDLLRYDGASPASTTPNRSRRTSMLAVPIQDEGSWDAPISTESAEEKLEKLRAGRINAEARDAALRQSMLDMSDFTTNTHRTLDDTYYLVLDKLGELQETMANLQALVQISQSAAAGMDGDVGDFLEDAASQLDVFGDFHAQETRIHDLQDRISAGQTRTKTLNDRVDSVDGMIQSWVYADAEWQSRTRKRLMVLWIIISTLFAITLLLYFGVGYVQEFATEREEDISTKLPTHPAGLDGMLEELREGNHSRAALNFSTSRSGDDTIDGLRALDEL